MVKSTSSRGGVDKGKKVPLELDPRGGGRTYTADGEEAIPCTVCDEDCTQKDHR